MASNKYTYRTYWSGDNGYYIARCLEFPSLTADGSSPEAAVKELSELVDFCVKDMQKHGENIPSPLGDRKFSGEFRLRIPPRLHRELVIESEETGISLNQIVLSRLHPRAPSTEDLSQNHRRSRKKVGSAKRAR